MQLIKNTDGTKQIKLDPDQVSAASATLQPRQVTVWEAGQTKTREYLVSDAIGTAGDTRAKSIVLVSGKHELDGDNASPGNNKYYGTSAAGTKGFNARSASGITGTATVTAITAWRYDNTTKKFQIKTNQLTVLAAVGESGWTTVTDGDDPEACD